MGFRGPKHLLTRYLQKLGSLEFYISTRWCFLAQQVVITLLTQKQCTKELKGNASMWTYIFYIRIDWSPISPKTGTWMTTAKSRVFKKIVGVEPKIGVITPKWMGFLMENLIKMEDLGGNIHYFRKHPYYALQLKSSSTHSRPGSTSPNRNRNLQHHKSWANSKEGHDDQSPPGTQTSLGCLRGTC